MSTTAKGIALAVIPKITGGTSFICSTFIVQHILRCKKKRHQTYHRLICGMSISDMFGSFFGFFLSTWPFPKETGIWGASGTVQSCDAAGFFNHAGNVCTPLYNGSLATFYLLLLRYNWTDSRIKRIEPILHAVPLLIGWSTAIAGLVMKLYGPANWICWIAPYPKGCISTGTCIRGFEDFNIYRWAFLYAEVWATIVYVAVAMIMVYWSVRQLENKSSRYHFSSTTTTTNAANTEEFNKKREKSKRVMKQAFLYVGAFFLTWIFGTITRLIQTINGQIFYPIIVLMTIFFPCQGLFNALIYFKPRFCGKKKKKTKQQQQNNKNKNDMNQELANTDISKTTISKVDADYSTSENNDTNIAENNDTIEESNDVLVDQQTTQQAASPSSNQEEEEVGNNSNNNKVCYDPYTSVVVPVKVVHFDDVEQQDDLYENFS